MDVDQEVNSSCVILTSKTETNVQRNFKGQVLIHMFFFLAFCSFFNTYGFRKLYLVWQVLENLAATQERQLRVLFFIYRFSKFKGYND